MQASKLDQNMHAKIILRWLYRALACALLLYDQADRCFGVVDVTNFGAKGDLLTLPVIDTVSNSTQIVCPGSSFVSSDVGKLVEVFNGGAWRGTSNETLLVSIAAVSSPTTIIASAPAGATANGLHGIYATDSTVGFSKAIANCSIPTDTVLVPSGNYLLVTTNVNSYWLGGVILRRGGITFQGEGHPTLTGMGGWRDNANGVGERGHLLLMLSPMTNDYPLIFTNLDFDGGTYGLTGNHDYPIHPDTGEGWDGTHHAVGYWTSDGSVTLTSSNYFLGCTFHGWRGEMVISGLPIQGGSMVASNCVFYDGNATALNMNMAHDWNSCIFSNMFQVEEFYRDYTTNASIFRNCILTNAGAIALNGSYYGCPTYTISNNAVYLTPNRLPMLTTPACDVLVVGNKFSGGLGIGLGAAGYQSTHGVCNSNLVFFGNYFTNCYETFIDEGAGINIVENALVVSNEFDNCAQIFSGYGWSTNILFTQNSGNFIGRTLFDSTSLLGQYAIESGDYTTPMEYENYFTGTTNMISYGFGSRGKISGYYPHVFYLDDKLGKIPFGATLVLSNLSSSISYPVYLNSAMAGSPLTLGPLQMQDFYWNGNAWLTNGNFIKNLVAFALPLNSFGSVQVGSSVTNNIVLYNAGNTMAFGSISVSPPFSLAGYPCFSVAPGQSTTVNVIFSPTSAGSFTNILNISGSVNTNCTLTGSASLSGSAVIPTVSPILVVSGTNSASQLMAQVSPGPMQLSASASTPSNDPLSWQWLDSVNGGAPVVYGTGSGVNPSLSVSNVGTTSDVTNLWTLDVTDTASGNSATSQVVVVVAPVSSPINEIPIPGQTLNVTNFGAIGDAVQCYVNTSSNSVLVTTTNVLPTSCVGDAIEIFGQGQSTYGTNSYGTVGYGNQDLIANITRVIRGTNVYISVPSQKSTAGAFATYGHENSANIQSAMAAVTNANAAIYFPSGNYLVLARSTSPGYGKFGIGLNRGGLAFTGDGPGNTRLISQGAWTLQGGSAWRGFLFEENPPVTNNLPFIIENMTVDGGIQQGNTALHGYPANPVDGQGWDLTHDAFVVANSAPDVAFNQMIWTNVVFQHWRGDMARTLDQGVNANLLVQNCSFLDGNATAFNLDSSICFSNCLLDNLFQVAQYSQAYSTNPCYFENNLCTNITGNTLEIVGGTGVNPGFVVCNNSFYLAGNGLNGIETGPADNLTVSNNTFVCQDYANVVNLGAAGYQGTFDNSNILITANSVINPGTFLEISGGSSATDPRRSESVIASGNVLGNPDFGVTLFQDGGWSTNVVLSGNNCSQFNNLQNSVLVQSAAGGVPYAAIGLDNQYFTQVQSPVAVTNVLSYGNGSRYYANNSAPGSAWVIQNSDASQIPFGAQVYFVNLNSFSIPFYLNSVNGGQTMIASGGSVTAAWQNNQWVLQGTNSLVNTTLAVSAISVSVPNAETNSTVYAVQPGSLQLSASTAGPAGDPIAWQWLVGVNGGPLASYSSGSGSNPALGLTYSNAQEGNTNLWVLQVTDTKSGVSAQTNLNLFVMLPSPQGIHFLFSVAGQ